MVRYVNRMEYVIPLPIPLEAAINLSEVAAYEEEKAKQQAVGGKLPDIIRPIIPPSALLQAFLEKEVIEKFYSTGAGRVCSGTRSLSNFYLAFHCLIIFLRIWIDEFNLLPVDIRVCPHSQTTWWFNSRSLQWVKTGHQRNWTFQWTCPSSWIFLNFEALGCNLMRNPCLTLMRRKVISGLRNN